MELSNTGLDSVDFSVLMTIFSLISATPPTSDNCSGSTSSSTTTPVTISAPKSESPNPATLPKNATPTTQVAIPQAAATPPNSLSGNNPDQSSGSTPVPIERTLSIYACKAQDCWARFTQQRQLRHHMVRHLRKTYTCDSCPAYYRHPKSLREHKQTKHQKKRYQCDIDGCSESVAQKKNLKRHKENKHGLFANDSIQNTHPSPFMRSHII